MYPLDMDYISYYLVLTKLGKKQKQTSVTKLKKMRIKLFFSIDKKRTELIYFLFL